MLTSLKGRENTRHQRTCQLSLGATALLFVDVITVHSQLTGHLLASLQAQATRQRSLEQAPSTHGSQELLPDGMRESQHPDEAPADTCVLLSDPRSSVLSHRPMGLLSSSSYNQKVSLGFGCTD